MLVLQFVTAIDEIEDTRYTELHAQINTILEKVEKILEDKERLQWYSNNLINISDVFFIWRGIGYAIGMEGSLKLKENSYIYFEAYVAGALKYAPISLIENRTIVLFMTIREKLVEKTISNMVEVKSHGAKVMVVTTVGSYFIEDTAEFVC